MMNSFRFSFAALAISFTFAATARGAQEADIDSYDRWDPEVVEAFESLAVQDGGRVKPVYSLSRVVLLQLLGSRSATIHVKNDEGEVEKVRLSPSEVLMDIVFRPEVARQLPLFLVNDSAAISAIGAEEHAKRRSRYSYAEIVGDSPEIVANPANSDQWRRLRNLAMEYSEIEQDKRDGKQNLIIDLFRNVGVFNNFANEFAFLRFNIGDYLPDEVPEKLKGATITGILESVPALWDKRNEDGEIVGADDELVALDAMMTHARTSAQRNATTLSFFAPKDKEEKEWVSGIELFDGVFMDYQSRDTEAAGEKIAKLRLLENTVAAADSGGDLKAPLAALDKEIIANAKPRGEAKHIATELSLFKGNYIANTKWIFTVAFVLAIFSWLSPGSRFGRWMRWGAMGVTAIAVTSLLYGMVLRGIIMERSGIGTLYETIISIAAAAAVLGLLFEKVLKNHIPLAVGIILGGALMFLADLYEASDGSDTMAPLVAVLRSNFWLSTHVVIVTLGYAAGIFAGFLAWVFVFGKLFGVNKEDRQFYRSLTRMVYGVICFGMLFSLIGTILGGIWGNYSWGRFWGWDPKENGALLIVLMNLIIVHARLGGLIRDLGINMLAIVGSCFVVFSWFYVNNMGVGLHSYGFTSGILKNVMIFWGIQSIVLLCGVVLFFMERSAAIEKRAGKEKKKKLADPEPSTA